MNRVELLKKKKKEIGITFDELAKKTGISRRAICGLFSGKTENPRIDTVQAIERALGLSPTFTQEERALGLSEQHLIAMSDRDRHRFHVLAFADEILGVDFVDTQINLLEIAANAKANAKNKK